MVFLLNDDSGTNVTEKEDRGIAEESLRICREMPGNYRPMSLISVVGKDTEG